MALKRVLNNGDIKGPNGPGTYWMSKASGLFKNDCPAKPQALRRAERTQQSVSKTKGRERRWQLFQQTLKANESRE